ncbi:MAG: nitroreductase family protein [Bacteroidales bacterium]|nr:nitroreductase family protein [Bacteroidales bacterium]HPY83111.1 nitroreductase family protein [Bacteroidales bacterium]
MQKTPITLNIELCVRCKLCEQDCPTGAIHIDTQHISNSCIACGHCVAICPTAALLFDNKPVRTLQPQSITAKQFVSLSAHTRSIRHFTSQKISEHILNKLIENLAHCPSSSNNRPVQITIVTDSLTIQSIEKETLQILYTFFSKLTKPVPKFILSLFLTKKEQRKLAYYKHSFEKKIQSNKACITYNAPAIMFFHGKELKTQSLKADANIWATYTSLYAQTYGIGSCFNGFIVQADAQSKKIKHIVNIPKDHTIAACLLLGYPKHTYTHETMRNKPQSTIV